jgi:hypothetical protein
MNAPDAITLAFQPRKSGKVILGVLEPGVNGRLQDLLIGYGLGSDMPRGWWRAHHILIRGPMRVPRSPQQEYWVGWEKYPTTSVRNERQRLIELHPAVGPWLGSFAGWNTWQARARMIAAPRIRERLERETGYSELYTREECADAALLYAANTMGAKALLALHRSNVWKEISPRAAA